MLTKRSFLILLLFACGVLAPQVGAQGTWDERTKASFLLGLVDFVRWELPRTGAPTFGIVGSDEVFEEARALAAEKRAKGREMEVIRFDDLVLIEEVDVLFVGIGQREEWESILAAVNDESILLVGEEPGFLEAGGLVEFVMRPDRLRFSINLQAAANCGIRVSSKLAQLAIDN